MLQKGPKASTFSLAFSAVATLALVGCGGALPADSPNQQELRYGSRVHKMPVRDSSAPIPYTAPAGAHLTYYGGRVVSNMQVVQVLWGGGSYLSNVGNTSSPSMATFYQGILNSPFTDMFSEYNTPASGGSNQIIGRGSFLRQVQITPAASGSPVDDSAIQTELANQIQAGILPAPTHDAAGNDNTYYAIFFPPGITITQGNSSSCVAGGFCAYHGTIANVPGHGEIYYGVHPDMQAGSGCASGCGGSTTFNNYTSVASHEMSETITDCEVGIAGPIAAPLAWYDSVNGENGDICNAQQAQITGSDGVSYTVQKEFSNAANDCIASRAVAGNDFAISASPSSVSVAQGAAGSSTISTSVTSGSASTVSLALSGAPSGVTASVSPASVTAGGSSTLTLSASTTATAGTYTITVKGTEGTASHSTSVSLTVTPAGGGGGGSGITNGGFETGSLSGWTASGASETVASSGCHAGTYCARLGATTPTNGDSSIAQTFTAPTGAASLSVWYKETCPDTVTYDWALATLKDNTAGSTATVIAKACATNAWTQATSSLTAGHSYTLTLTSHDDNYSSDPTYTLYDDATISTGGGGGGGGGITNGGFETGSFSGWTTSGASESISTSGCHGGTHCAQAGSTTPTNGDSNIVQTFSVPSGKSSLSVWYASVCPDTITYDWVTLTLKNNSTGTTTTMLPKTCASSSSWTNITASVSAGTSYTLTLTNHDDNYSADPTYTKFDDVTLN